MKKKGSKSDTEPQKQSHTEDIPGQEKRLQIRKLLCHLRRHIEDAHPPLLHKRGNGREYMGKMAQDRRDTGSRKVQRQTV